MQVIDATHSITTVFYLQHEANKNPKAQQWQVHFVNPTSGKPQLNNSTSQLYNNGLAQSQPNNNHRAIYQHIMKLDID